ncbi:hypothetical protein Hanom_Chr09g00860941 [Helianthus anomalus]
MLLRIITARSKSSWIIARHMISTKNDEGGISPASSITSNACSSKWVCNKHKQKFQKRDCLEKFKMAFSSLRFGQFCDFRSKVCFSASGPKGLESCHFHPAR